MRGLPHEADVVTVFIFHLKQMDPIVLILQITNPPNVRFFTVQRGLIERPIGLAEIFYSHLLTYLHLDKMTAISQKIFSDAFSWMKSFIFWLKIYRGLVLRVNKWTINQRWLCDKTLSAPMLARFIGAYLCGTGGDELKLEQSHYCVFRCPNYT